MLSGVLSENKKNYVCNENKMFTECFNNFCPLTKELTAVKDTLVVSGFTDVTENKVGDDITTAVDVALNTPFYTVFTKDDQEVYFKYNGKIFVIHVYDVDQYKGTATIEVSNVVT